VEDGEEDDYDYKNIPADDWVEGDAFSEFSNGRRCRRMCRR
jgi:hypothetical protein